MMKASAGETINHFCSNHFPLICVIILRFCGVCEDDRRFFGLVTGAGSQESSSSSCHVFMAEPITSQVWSKACHHSKYSELDPVSVRERDQSEDIPV